MKKYCLILACLSLAAFAGADLATDILKGSGVKGGLVVHLDCGDGKLTAALGEQDGYLVQGLDASAKNVETARRTIEARNLYGKVTAREFDGQRLPQIDNLANLIVVSDAKCKVPSAEIARALAPQGVAYVKQGFAFELPGFSRQESGDWIAFRKPRPADLDEWTHYQYNAQGTMVGGDQVVGPPRRIQWMGGPKWLRNHDFMNVMHVMVSSNGRIFYIIDEALRNHIFLPSRWTVVARDGFNGTILWKKPVKDWHPTNWPLKSGPGDLPRRMVAVGDRVYVTLGFNEPLTALDAATGETLETFKGTKGTEEIVLDDGVLFVVVSPDKQPVNFTAKATGYSEIGRANSEWAWMLESPERKVVAITAASGEVLWEHDAKVAPLSLAVGGDRVFYHNGAGLVALDRKSGERRWASEGPKVSKVPTGGSLRLAYSDGVLAFASGTQLSVFDAKKGEPLWNGKLQKTSHHCPEDLFIIDGRIWSPNTGVPQQNGTHYKVLNLLTGAVEKDFVAENIKGFPMHPRCYPSRATTKYIMTNGMGTEFYEVGGTTVDVNNTVRGSCIYGVMPCNGLLYKPPDSCACFYQSKLEHLCALAPASKTKPLARTAPRLEKGPAYNKIPNPQSPIPNRDAWPMYRGDAARSGFSASPVSPDLQPAWEVKLEGKLTQPVVVGGKVFVSAIDRQALYALDAASGKELWKHTAGGRIDSSPTLYEGAVLFGCADGWVYCLRADDGALAWRYLVAHTERQTVSYQQLESVWPVHGSVLIQNGVLFVLAGRNMFFDGGLRLARLNPATGEELSVNVMDENDPATGKNLQTLIKAKYMPIANADILSGDGVRVYMQEQNFDSMGKRLGIAPTQPGKTAKTDEESGRHLFCQTGLLDDAWFHRSFWTYGNDCGEGWGEYAGTRGRAPSGRIMAFDDSRVYAYRSGPLGNMLHPRTTYHLYAADKNPGASTTATTAADEPTKRQRRAKGAPKPTKGAGKAPKGVAEKDVNIAGHQVHWQLADLPFHVNAMALGAKTLFVAGPPDLADETKMLGYLPGADDEINKQLKAQDEAWRGQRGAVLWAVSAADGKKLAEYKLDNVPLFDGMSAAEGKLFLSMSDGSVVCFKGK